MNDEERLKAKLRAIEALYAGATTPGERVAAGLAQKRIATRLAELRDRDEVEWQFYCNRWSRRILLALARRYGIEPYRYKRQRRTTLVIRASERFLQETLIPQYEQMCNTLDEHLDAVTKRVVAEVIHASTNDEAVVDSQPQQLEAFSSTSEPSNK
ncbi:hypothetical protein ACFL6C_07055 [Myxococcota bacterium]